MGDTKWGDGVECFGLDRSIEDLSQQRKRVGLTSSSPMVSDFTEGDTVEGDFEESVLNSSALKSARVSLASKGENPLASKFGTTSEDFIRDGKIPEHLQLF